MPRQYVQIWCRVQDCIAKTGHPPSFAAKAKLPFHQCIFKLPFVQAGNRHRKSGYASATASCKQRVRLQHLPTLRIIQPCYRPQKIEPSLLHRSCYFHKSLFTLVHWAKRRLQKHVIHSFERFSRAFQHLRLITLYIQFQQNRAFQGNCLHF